MDYESEINTYTIQLLFNIYLSVYLSYVTQYAQSLLYVTHCLYVLVVYVILFISLSTNSS